MQQHRDAGFQALDELRFHELIAIGNIQTDDFGVTDVRSVPTRKPPAMDSLHHNDDLSPFKDFGAHHLVGVGR